MLFEPLVALLLPRMYPHYSRGVHFSIEVFNCKKRGADVLLDLAAVCRAGGMSAELDAAAEVLSANRHRAPSGVPLNRPPGPPPTPV